MHFISNIWGLLLGLVMLAVYLINITSKEISPHGGTPIRFEDHPIFFSVGNGAALMFSTILCASSISAVAGLEWLEYFKRGSEHASIAWASAWLIGSLITYMIASARS